MLAVAYEKTQELARDLRGVGCGDLDVEGVDLFMSNFTRDDRLDTLIKFGRKATSIC